MKKIRKILYASATALIGGSAIAAAVAMSIAPSTSHHPKFLGIDSNGIALYEFNNKAISFNGKYYQNSYEAVVDNVIQKDIAGKNDKKLIMDTEKFLGQADSNSLNGGTYATLDVNKAKSEHKIFSYEDKSDKGSLTERTVPLYENSRTNSDSQSDYNRYLTDREKAAEALISNYDTGLAYTDGFGGVFKDRRKAEESFSKNLKNSTAVGMGYYLIDDYAHIDAQGNPKKVKINPLNPYDRKLLKQIAVNNLNKNGSKFTLELFNKEQERTPGDAATYSVARTADESGDSVYAFESDPLNSFGSNEVAKTIAHEFSEFVHSKLDSLIRYDITLNPTWMNRFNMVLHANHAANGWPNNYPGQKTWYYGMKPDAEEHDYSYGYPEYAPIGPLGEMRYRNKDPNAFLRLEINGQKDLTFFNKTEGELLSLKNILSNRTTFLRNFNIESDIHRIYHPGHLALGYKADPLAERAKGKLFGQDVNIGITIEADSWNWVAVAMDRTLNPSKPFANAEQGYNDGYYGTFGNITSKYWWFVGPKKEWYPVDGMNSFKFLDTNQVKDDKGAHVTSGMAINLFVTPKVNTNELTIKGWADEFIKHLREETNVLKSELDPTNIVKNQVDELFGEFASYVTRDLSKKQIFIPWNEPDKYNKFKNVGDLTSDFNFTNPSSYVNDFFSARQSIRSLDTKLVSKTTHNFAANLANNDSVFVVKYNNVPLYTIKTDYLDKLGMLERCVTRTERGDVINLASAGASLQSALISQNKAEALYESLNNISNKIELKLRKVGDTVVQKYSIPGVNLNSDPNDDVNFVKLDKTDTNQFKKIVIPDEYSSITDPTNPKAVKGLKLNAREADPVSLLRRNSGIYMIAQQYNDQLAKLYQTVGKPDGPNLSDPNSEEIQNLIKSEEDIIVLYQSIGEKQGTDAKISDYIEPAFFTEMFQRAGTYNATLNNPYTSKQAFNSVPEKERFFNSMSDRAVNESYIYLDLNNRPLNQDLYNNQEGALSEAVKNTPLYYTDNAVLVVDPKFYDPSKQHKDYKLSDGWIVKKNIQELYTVNAERLADKKTNGWTNETIYFANHQNAFNYCRYLFEKSYTIK